MVCSRRSRVRSSTTRSSSIARTRKLPRAPADVEEHQQRDRHRAHGHEPRVLPDLRLDLDLQRRGIGIPPLPQPRRRRRDEEPILAGPEVGVLRDALVAALDPACVHAFEPIAVTQQARHLETQAGVVEFELARARRQDEFGLRGQHRDRRRAPVRSPPAPIAGDNCATPSDRPSPRRARSPPRGGPAHRESPRARSRRSPGCWPGHRLRRTDRDSPRAACRRARLRHRGARRATRRGSTSATSCPPGRRPPGTRCRSANPAPNRARVMRPLR